MDINRLTEKAQEALRAAQSEATRQGHQQIDVEHLLLALLEQEGGLAKSILEKSNVDPDLVRQRVQAEVARMPKVSSSTGGGGDVYISGRLNRLLVQPINKQPTIPPKFRAATPNTALFIPRPA